MLNKPDFAEVAPSGSYVDLLNKPTIPAAQIQSNWNQSDNTKADYIKNKPMIPEAQVNSDWDAVSGVAQILHRPSLATVATSGDYNDLANKPTIPAAQVNSDWDAVSGVAQILHKPNLSTVATSGSYNDLSNKPTIPTVGNGTVTIMQGGETKGSFTMNQSGDTTITLGQGIGSVSWDDVTGKPTFATVATSGDYDDLANKPTIPAAQVNSDWDAVSGVAQILHRPSLATVATSGDYGDLANKPTIPAAQVQSNWNEADNTKVDYIKNKPTNVSAFSNDAGYLTSHQDISGKYDKTGGTITGDVDIEGQLELDIQDDDYDVGITMNGSLDNNLGTILTLQGYADNTNYKPIIRNIGTCSSNYDAANKKYVDEHILVPTYYLVALNSDGSVDTYTQNLDYSTIHSNLTMPSKADYLDVLWEDVTVNEYTRFYAKCIGIREVNNGDLLFEGMVYFLGVNFQMVFALNSNNVLTTLLSVPIETLENKKTTVTGYSTSNDFYPSCKAVFDEFQRKPVVVWEETTPANYLKAIQSDLRADPAWQLTNLDLTPYKRIKIYTCAGRKSSGVGVDASTTPASVLEMSLDARAAIAAYGGNYCGSVEFQKPNDANRFATLTCAVSADKTKFVVLRQTNIYGTAATANDDANANVFMIEGYYD